MSLYQSKWHLHLYVEHPTLPDPLKEVEITKELLEAKFNGWSPALVFRKYQENPLHPRPSLLVEFNGSRLGDLVCFLLTNEDVACPWVIHSAEHDVWHQMNHAIWSSDSPDLFHGDSTWHVANSRDIYGYWTVSLPTGPLTIKWRVPGV